MGLLSRIRGFFSSCIRSTSSSSSNEENRRSLGSNDFSQSNSSRHIARCVNYERSNTVQNRINNPSILHHEHSSRRNFPRLVVSSTKAESNYGTIKNNARAEMTIQKIDELNGSNICVFHLNTLDVWRGESEHGYCNLGILSSGENEVIQKKRMISATGSVYFEITIRGQQPWSRDVLFTLNGEPVPNAEKIEVLFKLEGMCRRALKNGDYKSIPDFIEFNDFRVFIPLSVGDDDGKFLPYDEANCELLPGNNEILCKHTKRDEILGPGFAYINNIARVIKLKNPLTVHEIPADNIVIIDLIHVLIKFRHICKEVVQHLLRGLYYRRKASDAATVRMEWKNRMATLSKLLGTKQSMKTCKIFKDYFGILMNRYNRKACDELFAFFNFHREVCEVDLHGLYVADEKKLELLRIDLLQGTARHKDIDNGRGVTKKNSKKQVEVDNIIEKFRSENDEAIRKLEITLESFDIRKAIKNNTPWLEIIVGAGNHSKNNKQNIRPKVEKLLRERSLTFAPVNKGSLVVTFLKYSGPEPCFGQYYCEKCDYRWKSNQSYVEEYEKCVHCQDSCWPLKQREKEKVENYYRLSNVK